MRFIGRLRTVIAWAMLGGVVAGCGSDVPAADVPDPPSQVSDPDLARLLRDRTARVRSSATSAEAWGRLALAYDAHDFSDRALESYARAAELEPGRFDWPYLRATVLAQTDQVAALDWLDRAASIRDDHAPLYARRGQGHLAVGEVADARVDFSRALELDDRLVAAHLGLAKVALAEDRVEDARAHAERALELGPRSDETYGVLAQAHQRSGDDAAAAAALAQVDDGGRREPLPDAVRAQVRNHGVTTDWIRVRVDDALRRRDAEAALELWEGARASKPGDVAVLIGHARTLRTVGRGADARAALEAARDLLQTRGDGADRRQSGSVALGLGLDSLSRGDVDAAKAELDQALGFDPDLAEARGYRGVAAMMSGELGRGLELLRAASTDLAPDHALQFNLATALVEAELWQEAREVLTRVVDAGAATGRTYSLLGRVLGGLGEYGLAAEAFESFASLEPANEVAYSNRARALAKAGRHAAAAEAHRSLCERFPTSARAKQRRAWFLATTPDAALVDGATAVSLATALLTQEPDNIELLSLAAAAAAAAGQFEDAVGHETEALERLGSTSPVAGRSVDDLRALILERLDAYRSGQRWIER